MLLIKSKYKIAKRLGAAVFEKTQTQKFALSEARTPPKKTRGGRGGGSDYGRQLLEKQRVRFTYGLSEKQLSKYAAVAFTEADPSTALHRALEMRADSVIYRAGFASTRRAARQIVSHGHITINGKRTTVPSYRVRVGDVIGVREGSRQSPLFTILSEKNEETLRSVPQWLKVDRNALHITVTNEPSYNSLESGLAYSTLFEFYSR
ncbi:30S ribosomal protein S4 [Candidatus Kaiserbacteria bacterium CG10_big_fil_rev_8_21_14_0_10_51_14]|uniref:Small ribosomal subunit protein uS4 n=1 Tax=Candidatus Kaiserbacteria bacterium CG10_big_fil_rev_8_21_14_0_10_51_14 TaxID=1974610 RepID=A0A2H0UD10_9BACT|nr:MAG: 30S ribosomal protein S4 [Candidatus Kaiserbacteria bacterium CG10_big_fil_rev_8_21_14_0_10_51_14]